MDAFQQMLLQHQSQTHVNYNGGLSFVAGSGAAVAGPMSVAGRRMPATVGAPPPAAGFRVDPMGMPVVGGTNPYAIPVDRFGNLIQLQTPYVRSWLHDYVLGSNQP